MCIRDRVFHQVRFRHPYAGVRDGDGLVLLVRGDADFQRLFRLVDVCLLYTSEKSVVAVKSLENGAEALFQVFENVVDMFRAYGKPHRGGRDACRLQ